jgi:hypothetical protein
MYISETLKRIDMATIKSFTDLSQSKKLAEILPLESADMVYTMTNGYHTPWVRRERIEELDTDDVCAWSLAALLSVLPDYTLQTNTDGTVFVVCENRKPMISDAYDNPVDACVAMIEKLHELNLL